MKYYPEYRQIDTRVNLHRRIYKLPQMITYRATNTLTGKFYIGSTSNFERRKKEHLNSTVKWPFQNALRKNPNVWEWEVWEDGSDDPILEQALLDMWVGKEFCYNICPIANRAMAGRKHKEESKKKMSVANTGKKHTEEAKKKIAEATRKRRTGVRMTEETKKKLSEINSGEKSPKFGKPVSAETREKIRKGNLENAHARGKKWWVNEGKEVKFSVECPGEGWKRGRK